MEHQIFRFAKAFTLCGRRGTWRHRPRHLWHWAGSGGALGSRCLRIGVAVCVAGVALGNIQFHVAWQAWHLVTSTFTLSGRRGTCEHRPSLCVAGVAGVAFGDIDLHFVCQARHLWHSPNSGGALASRFQNLLRNPVEPTPGSAPKPPRPSPEPSPEP